MGIPLAEQVECVEREIRMREKTFPRHVTQGKLTQSIADLELERMRAVLVTLKTLSGSGIAVARTVINPDLQAARADERKRILAAAGRCMHSSALVRLEAMLEKMP